MTDFFDGVLDPIIKRMVERLRITRSEVLSAVLGQNQQVHDQIEKALPELEHSLSSRPDLLRLIMEIYGYIENESEALSQVIAELREARRGAARVAKLTGDIQVDLASVETYLNAIEVYLQTEPATISHVLQLFEAEPLQTALDSLPDERFLQLDNVLEQAKAKRGW